MAYLPNSGSVVAFQSDPSKLQASITGVVDVRSIPSIYGNISGSVAAIVTNFPTNQNVSGSVAAWLQSTNASVITVGTAAANQSVSGTVGASIIGAVPITQSGTIMVSVAGTQALGDNVASPNSVLGTAAFLMAFDGTNWDRVRTAASGTLTTGQVGGNNALGDDSSNTQQLMTTNDGSGPFWFRASNFLFNGVNWDRQRGNSSIGALVSTASSSVITVSKGSVITIIQTSTTPSVYQVLSSISTVSIMALNAARKGATIYNRAGTTVYVKLGTAADTSVFTVLMANDAYYELPFGYTGVVAGITASNAGTINVTELT